MGLLDDLKNQSESLKAKEAQERQRKADLEKYYQDHIHPKMLQIYSFLTELGEHLNFIKADTTANYPILPKGISQSFKQKNYKVTIDSSKNVKNINFQFECHLFEPIKFEMDGGEIIQRYSDVLDSYRMKYRRNDFKNDEYELINANFKLEGPIVVNILLQGDVENSSIILMLNNFEKPGSVKHIFKDRHVTEEFLDGLGKYILRENPKFFSLDIDERDKEILRQRVAEDRKRRQEELEEAERLLQEEEEREKQANKSWTNLFKKKP